MTSEQTGTEHGRTAGAPREPWATRAVWSLVAASTVYLIIAGRTLAMRVPLGHDETIYLLRARSYVDGVAASELEFWAPYRAPGLSFILSLPMRLVGESVTLSRTIVALSGLVAIALTALLVGRLAGPRAAAVAPWLVVICPAFSSYSGLILLDVPAAAFVLAAVLLLEASTRDGHVRWIPGLLMPVACLLAAYVRFGVAAPLLAGAAAVLVARAPALLADARRVQNVVRVTVIGLASGAMIALVLLVPAMTGVTLSPLGQQQRRQEAKDLSSFASYGDLADVLWPNGSRADEAMSWVSLVVLLVGFGLSAIAARSVRHRLAAAAGAASVLVWLALTNVALAEMFGNYVGLGVPFLALAAAPGWASAIERIETGAGTAVSVGWAIGALAMIAGSLVAFDAAHDQVARQRGNEVYRAAGGALGAVSVDGRCGLVAAYVQVAWYADCRIVPFTFAGGGGAYRTGVTIDAFPEGRVDPDELYVLTVNRGKRQPEGDDLATLLDGAELVATVEHPTRTNQIWRLPPGGG